MKRRLSLISMIASLPCSPAIAQDAPSSHTSPEERTSSHASQLVDIPKGAYFREITTGKPRGHVWLWIDPDVNEFIYASFSPDSLPYYHRVSSGTEYEPFVSGRARISWFAPNKTFGMVENPAEELTARETAKRRYKVGLYTNPLSDLAYLPKNHSNRSDGLLPEGTYQPDPRFFSAVTSGCKVATVTRVTSDIARRVPGGTPVVDLSLDEIVVEPIPRTLNCPPVPWFPLVPNEVKGGHVEDFFMFRSRNIRSREQFDQLISELRAKLDGHFPQIIAETSFSEGRWRPAENVLFENTVLLPGQKSEDVQHFVLNRQRSWGDLGINRNGEWENRAPSTTMLTGFIDSESRVIFKKHGLRCHAADLRSASGTYLFIPTSESRAKRNAACLTDTEFDKWIDQNQLVWKKVNTSQRYLPRFED